MAFPLNPPTALPTAFDNDNMESLSLGAPLVDSNSSQSDLQYRETHVEATLPCPASIGNWTPDMSLEEKRVRRQWLSGGRGRKGLRIMIVTENFLPKVDGVTRTLARLLTHLEAQGHECMVLGPQTGMVSDQYSSRAMTLLTFTFIQKSHYASHPLVGTLGLPLIVYPGLKVCGYSPRWHVTRSINPHYLNS